MKAKFIRVNPRAGAQHARPHRHETAARPPSLRLSQGYRRAVYGILAAAWLTGILWLVLHYFMQRTGEFGLEPHPLEAWSLRLHGIAAFAALWLGGLLWALHVRPGLSRPARRSTGIVLIASLLILASSGYLLYYASEDWLRDSVRLIHWIIGLILIVPFCWHSMRARKFSRR